MILLFSEIPGHRDQLGNKNRSIFRIASAKEFPILEAGSAFIILSDEQELRRNTGLLEDKFGCLRRESDKFFDSILRQKAPSGWRLQEILIPSSNLRTNEEIHIFRSAQYPEQMIIVADSLDRILIDIQLFTQGETVHAIYNHFQAAINRYAMRQAEILLKLEPQSAEEAQLLKRSTTDLHIQWQLAREFFGHQHDWTNVMQKIELAKQHAIDRLSYFPVVSPITAAIIAGGNVVAGGDIRVNSNNVRNTKPEHNWKRILIEIVVGVLVVAIGGYLLFVFGWN